MAAFSPKECRRVKSGTLKESRDEDEASSEGTPIWLRSHQRSSKKAKGRTLERSKDEDVASSEGTPIWLRSHRRSAKNANDNLEVVQGMEMKHKGIVW